jgi:hypothetical protein
MTCANRWSETRDLAKLSRRGVDVRRVREESGQPHSFAERPRECPMPEMTYSHWTGNYRACMSVSEKGEAGA